jgi:hypothetical protein
VNGWDWLRHGIWRDPTLSVELGDWAIAGLCLENGHGPGEARATIRERGRRIVARVRTAIRTRRAA